MSFVHLNIYTHYSCDVSNITIPELYEKASMLGLSGIAITDFSRMCGVPEFLSCAQKYPEIKPVIGCTVSIRLCPVILLAKNLTGYRNLLHLSTLMNLGRISDLNFPLLKNHNEGLICLSGGMHSEVIRAILTSGIEKAREIAIEYKQVFGDDYYFEASLWKRECTLDRELISELSGLGRELGIKLVAINPVNHINELISEDEMRTIFAEHPVAVDNTMEILEKIDRYDIHRDIALPKVSDNPKQELRNCVYEGALERYGHITDSLKERIDFELSTISQIGFESYFLIIKELTDWARAHHHFAGPGRGSAPGSVVNYCLKITDIDPLAQGLLFERFLNPERIQLPDIDIDLDSGGFDNCTKHLIDKYGKEQVSRVVCFYRNEEGVITGMGVHACANLLSSTPLTDYVPMMKRKMDDGDEYFLSQYDVHWVENAGILKIDILGLRTLDILREVEALIWKKRGININLLETPLDDEATFELYKKGNTDDIFQFEPEKVQSWLKKIQPESFPQLVALNSMFSSEAMNFFSSYASRKLLLEPVRYIIAETEDILAETYGLILYQEQIMMIAQQIAGFTPGQSDKLRKTVGSIKPVAHQLAAHFRDHFITGGLKRGYDHHSLEMLWQNIVEYGAFAYLKSHAVAYTWLSYQCAWLKAHYPDEYAHAKDIFRKFVP